MIPVVFTFNRKILMGAGVSIRSLIDAAHPETQYDIYVIHPDLSRQQIAAYQKLCEGTLHRISGIKLSPDRFAGFPKNRGSWTEIVYYRMLIPELLKDYDKAIYSDTDVFFKKDLSEVYATNLDGFEWGGVRAELNTPDARGHQYYQENAKKFIFWSGFMLLNCKEMRDSKTYDKCQEIVHKFHDRLRMFDLEVLNLACDKIKALPLEFVTLESIYVLGLEKAQEYNFLKNLYSDAELSQAQESPAIIHYAGQLGKPWHRKRMPEYYQKCVDSLPQALQKLTFRDWRKRLFNKKSYSDRLEG